MAEFQEFSMGHDKITATDFAEFLLRFANLTDEVRLFSPKKMFH